MNLEKITKQKFLDILGKNLEDSLDECNNMFQKIKEEPTDISKYYDTMLTLLDSANHNASLYCRVECFKPSKDIFYFEKNRGVPVLKFSKLDLVGSNTAYG